MDIGYGSSSPFAGNHNPGRYGRFFIFWMFFQRFLLARFIRKNVSAVKFSPQRYLKVLLSGIVIGVPYITCHEGIKR
ncbi:hypothetical protein ACLB1R_05185 [Escherichia coli]